jgi:hypothetical protein
MSERTQVLLGRLQKGIDKTSAIFRSFGPVQWETVVYPDPYPWTARDLLAHFLSAEEGLLRLTQDIAAGGPGAPEGFDYNAFNASEHERLAGIPPEQLLVDLAAARQRTLEWVTGVSEVELDRVGSHPALGEVSVEAFLNAIYGHQLFHMRDLKAALEQAAS